RARVLLVNSQMVKEADRPKSIWDLAHPRFKGQAVMAKPQYGTTATHAACLFQALGTEEGQRFFRALRENQVQLMAGNKPVAVAGGQGRDAGGPTGTGAAIAEVDAGPPG